MRPFIHILSLCIKTAFFLTALFLLCFILVTSPWNQPGGVEWFGYRFLAVRSDSMRPLFASGDLVVIRRCDPSQLQKGDVISFYSPDPSHQGLIVTHQIDQVVQSDGVPSFVTKGASSLDLYPVPFHQVLGIYQGHIPAAGRFLSFLKSPPGYLLLVLFPFLCFLFGQTARFLRLLKQYRQQALRQLEHKRIALQQSLQENACALQYNRYLIRRLEEMLESLRSLKKEDET